MMKMEIGLLSYQLLFSASVILVSKGGAYMGWEGNAEIGRNILRLDHPEDQKSTLVVAYRVLRNGWEPKTVGKSIVRM